ncbi:hypothetical protein IKG60_01465 [Candidatus Saccharibacteria bacterium]|nr:hypothetical protein [Candidatus Saccharibacteria bacterium]
MLNYRIKQPIRMTREMRDDEFMKYVSINERALGATPPNVLDTIRWNFYQAHDQDYDEETINKIWRTVRTRIAKNPGLANFTLDYDGAKSDFFFPWLSMVSESPATALEMAYGSGYNLAGDWVDEVPMDDEIYPFVQNDPTFVVHREKMDYIANLAINVRNTVPEGTKTKIVDLGAGRVMWAMRHRDILEPEKQTILAFDKDPMIPDSMFDQEETGIIYKNTDFASELWQPNCLKANLVILSGVASYYPTDVFRIRVLHPVYNALRHGGVFLFDLQLDCPYYRRSMSIFNWPKIDLARDLNAAIDKVERLRRVMWKQGMRFSAEYKPDTFNSVPSTVMITLTKI